METDATVGRGAIPAGLCLGQKSNSDSHTHRDSSAVRGFHTSPVYLQPVCEGEGSDLAGAEGPRHHNQDQIPGILCSSLGPFITRHRTQLLLVGGTTDFNRQKSLILFFFKLFILYWSIADEHCCDSF